MYFVQGEQDRTEETSETKKTGGEVEEVAENLAHIYTIGVALHLIKLAAVYNIQLYIYNIYKIYTMYM